MVTVGAAPAQNEFAPGWWREPDVLALTGVFVGTPILWFLGVEEISFLVVGLYLGALVLLRGNVDVPRGFGFWLLFLVWSTGGILVLTVQAPGSLAGDNVDRILVFMYRIAWYLAVTSVMLYIGNTSRRRLPTLLLVRLLAVGFVVVVAGGYLGIAFPGLSFTSAAEVALGPLAHIQFVKDIVHPIASVRTPAELGFVAARPSAPFTYANSWGAAFAVTLPFFMYSCFGATGRRLRAPGVAILVLSLGPFVYSLNRALWIAVLVQTVAAVVMLARRRRPIFAWGLTAVVVAVLTALIATPLGALILGRIQNPTSNERRGLLSVATVRSAFAGSPLLGFGSDRRVAGNFASIAGGATNNCYGCGSPPLGTQGQLWFIIFAHGFVGASLFIAFYWMRYWDQRHDFGVTPTIGRLVLLTYATILPFYDTWGIPQFLVMMALGIAWRESRKAPARAPTPLVTAGLP